MIFPKIFLTISLPVLLLLSNLYLFTSPLWLRYEYRKSFSFPDDYYNYTKSKRLELAEMTLNYIRSNKNIDLLHNLKEGGSSVYSKLELAHLAEIKNLIQRIFDIHLGALIVSLFSLSILWLNKQTRWKTPRYVLWGCISLFAIIGVLLIAISISWRKLFLGFHQIFFTQGTYSFTSAFNIIQLFPQRFWFDTILAWLFLTLIETIILASLMLWIKRLKTQ